MKSQTVDHVLLKKTFSPVSLRSLVEGYILNCRCESKSTATVANYQHRLACFIWFCQASGFLDEPGKLTTTDIRQFLWYLASEPNRWGGSSTSAQRSFENVERTAIYGNIVSRNSPLVDSLSVEEVAGFYRAVHGMYGQFLCPNCGNMVRYYRNLGILRCSNRRCKTQLEVKTR